MIDAIRTQLEAIISAADSMGQNSGLLLDLNGWNSTLAGVSSTVASNIVLPIALVILSLFWILELYEAFIKSSGQGSGNYMMWNVFLSIVKMFLCLWAVQNSTVILNALFGISAQITSGISAFVGSGEVASALDAEALAAAVEGGFFEQLGVQSVLLIVSVCIKIVGIAINTIVAARFIELYIYNAFAAIPLTTLCYSELHGVGVGFLKSYAGVALQGCIIYLVIGFYPALAAALGNSGGSLLDQAWGLLGQAIILFIAVLMSGRFAKAVTSAIA